MIPNMHSIRRRLAISADGVGLRQRALTGRAFYLVISSKDLSDRPRARQDPAGHDLSPAGMSVVTGQYQSGPARSVFRPLGPPRQKLQARSVMLLGIQIIDNDDAHHLAIGGCQ